MELKKLKINVNYDMNEKQLRVIKKKLSQIDNLIDEINKKKINIEVVIDQERESFKLLSYLMPKSWRK